MKPIFTIFNRHALSPEGQEPPCIDGQEQNIYRSYFESSTGDQSIFVYRRDTKEAVLYSGDAEWAAVPVVDGRTQGFPLSPDEELWLRACHLATRP